MTSKKQGKTYLVKVCNVKALFQDRWRITKDPAWKHEPRNEREHLYTVPCKRGGKIGALKANIYSHSLTHLGFVGAGPKLRRELLAVSGVVAHQTGDREFSVVFPIKRVNAVAEVVKPYLTRRKAPLETASTGPNEAQI